MKNCPFPQRSQYRLTGRPVWLNRLAILLTFSLAGYKLPIQPFGKTVNGSARWGNSGGVWTKPDTVPKTELSTVRFGFGQPATTAQIARLDIDVRPDGAGLPAGSGTAATGAVIFAATCAACHGTGGTGGPNGALVTTTPPPGKRPGNVIGNYWPYATTVFDYVRRAMPFNKPGSLTNEEVYALTAYLLTANGILDEKTVLNAQTLPKVVMPAQKRFVPDDRKGGPEVK